MLKGFSLLLVVQGVLLMSCTSFRLSTNPLLEDWKGPYQGVPPFDQAELADYKPALVQVMAEGRVELAKLATQPEAPTFANTIFPLEVLNEKFQRLVTLFYIRTSNLSDEPTQKVEEEIAPLLAGFLDEMFQNAQLYARVDQVLQNSKDLNPEQKRLVWHYHKSFVLAGAALKPEVREQVAAINQKLAKLYTQFSQNVLHDENKTFLHLTKEEELAGLPAGLVKTAAQEAKSRKLPGWVIANTRSSMVPFLTASTLRPLREKAFRLWAGRGDHQGPHDNNPLITQVLKLRQERAKLLGFKSYAHWQVSDKMAKTPERTLQLMEQVWGPAKKQLRVDVQAMQKIIDQEKGGFKLQAWDYAHYSEKLRKKTYDLNMDEVTGYLQLDNVQKAMFWMAQELYGLNFTQVQNVPTYHPDVTVYEVRRKGDLVGLWYFDPFARPGKRSGAWMNAYREQHRLFGTNTITMVSNNSNFIKGQEGEPTLLSWDDASTMFHEFGHALHGLLANVTYPTLSGTNTLRDFVEFPSQIHESWLTSTQVLRFLKNSKGETIPDALVAKIKKASAFNQGFETVEYLASAIVDMKIHMAQGDVDPRRFEKEELSRLGMPAEVVMRHRLPHFTHVFANEFYAAGYYSYIWADVLRRDAFEAFEQKGLYNRELAQKFHDKILSVGNTVDPDEAFRSFRGRGPQVKALLKAKGLTR